MQDLTISLIQSNLYWEEKDANMAMFEEKVWNIDHTDLIVLPEMFTTGFSMNAKEQAEPVGGKTFQWMRQMAKQKNAAITGSYIVKEENQFFNRLHFVFPDGSLEKYDKRHLFSLAGEDEPYTAGQERLIVDYKGWRINPMICYDLRFPVWSRTRSSDDSLYEYDLLIYAANWPKPRIAAWDTLLKARAIENISFCAGLNRTGTDELGHEYPGHSGIYAFDGEQLAFSSSEEIVSATLSAEALSNFRERFPFQRDADRF